MAVSDEGMDLAVEHMSTNAMARSACWQGLICRGTSALRIVVRCIIRQGLAAGMTDYLADEARGCDHDPSDECR